MVMVPVKAIENIPKTISSGLKFVMVWTQRKMKRHSIAQKKSMMMKLPINDILYSLAI